MLHRRLIFSAIALLLFLSTVSPSCLEVLPASMSTFTLLDNQVIATVDESFQLGLYRNISAPAFSTFDLKAILTGNSSTQIRMSFSKNYLVLYQEGGSTIYTLFFDENTKSLDYKGAFDGHSSQILDFKASPLENRVFSSDSLSILFWDIKDKITLLKIGIPDARSLQLMRGRLLAINTRINIIDVREGRYQTFNRMTFAPNQTILSKILRRSLVVAQGKQVSLINMENFELIESFGLEENILQIGLDPKTKNLFILTTAGSLVYLEGIAQKKEEDVDESRKLRELGDFSSPKDFLLLRDSLFLVSNNTAILFNISTWPLNFTMEATECGLTINYNNTNITDNNDCSDNCLSCEANGMCNVCMDNYQLTSFGCELINNYDTNYTNQSAAFNCSFGFYLDVISNSCQECAEGCNFCTEINSCNVCNANYYLDFYSKSCIATKGTYNYTYQSASYQSQYISGSSEDDKDNDGAKKVTVIVITISALLLLLIGILLIKVYYRRRNKNNFFDKKIESKTSSQISIPVNDQNQAKKHDNDLVAVNTVTLPPQNMKTSGINAQAYPSMIVPTGYPALNANNSELNKESLKGDISEAEYIIAQGDYTLGYKI